MNPEGQGSEKEGSSLNRKSDYGKEAKQLLEAIKVRYIQQTILKYQLLYVQYLCQVTGETYGLGIPILLLRGSSSQRLPVHFRSNELHGCGKLAKPFFFSNIEDLKIFDSKENPGKMVESFRSFIIRYWLLKRNFSDKYFWCYHRAQ